MLLDNTKNDYHENPESSRNSHGGSLNHIFGSRATKSWKGGNSQASLTPRENTHVNEVWTACQALESKSPKFDYYVGPIAAQSSRRDDYEARCFEEWRSDLIYQLRPTKSWKFWLNGHISTNTVRTLPGLYAA